MTGAKLHLTTTLMGGKETSLDLPEVRLSGLGQGPQGITAAELTELVLKQILENATKVAAQQMGARVSDRVKDEANRGAQKMGEQLGDLLKKK